VPFVQATVIGATAQYATAANVTTSNATIHVWAANGTDVGGIVNVSATGE
jgi:hypothetical protein